MSRHLWVIEIKGLDEWEPEGRVYKRESAAIAALGRLIQSVHAGWVYRVVKYVPQDPAK